MGKNKTGYPAPVPQTGQEKCYDYHGESPSSWSETNVCGNNHKGQDGNEQMGVTWPEPRFKDNRNGTVTDRLTGLIWLKNANCARQSEAQEGRTTWKKAFEWVEELNLSGTMNGKKPGGDWNEDSHPKEWRLPNVRELQSLIDYGQSDPALPADHPFDNVQSSYYWSSSADSSNPANGWCVFLGNGNASLSVKTSSSYYVWPVRGGQ